MNRTTMEKPIAQDRNFSIVVPQGLYQSLRKIMAINDGMSLGGVCRHILEIIPFRLYQRLQAVSNKEKVPIVALARKLLEEGLSKFEK